MTQAQAGSYTPGVPIWVDLGSPDPKAAAEFYGGLFDWTHQELGPEAGGYGFFFKDGQMVAGVGPLQGEGMPPVWSTYVATDDADAVAEKVTAAGGQVLVPPMDVMGSGRMACFLDPAGAAISVWQPLAHFGSELTNAPGSFIWNELNTRDLPGAKAFYPKVFGWGVSANPMGDIGEYVEWQVGGESKAGAMAMPPDVPDEVPPHWLTYFAVEDADAAAERVGELGGSIAAGPMDSPAGRFAVVSDPHGAVFAVIQIAPNPSST